MLLQDKEDPMLLEASLPLPTAQLSTPPAIKLPRLDPVTGPLYFDASGVWATTVTQLVVSPTEHIPDLLTGPDGEPWILSFFYFYIFQNRFLQKYIFGFIIYSFVPLSPGCGAAGPLLPRCRAVGT